MKSSLLPRIAAPFLFALLAAPATIAPQETSTAKENPQYQYRTGVNVVLVPVVVTDKQGRHVPGLTAADFELKQEGNVQKIASVDEVSAETTRAHRPTLPPNMFTNQVAAEHPKKLEILALDLVNNPFVNQADARRGLLSFLAKGSSEDTLVALVAFRPDGVYFVHDFTSDSAVLAAAVRKLQAGPTARDLPTADVRGDVDAEAVQLASIIAGGGSSTPAATPAAARTQLSGASAQLDASRASQNGLVTMECFQVVAQYFAAVPGRKSLVWASVGFNFSLGGMPGELTGGTTWEVWERTMRMLQDANIAVYPVDVGGLLPGSALEAQTATSVQNLLITSNGTPAGIGARSAAMASVEAGRFLDPVEAKHSTMRTVAEMTGGRPYYNMNDLDQLFRRAGLDSGQYYMLAYPLKEAGKSGWRKLSVKVHRDGVQVHSRTGFYYRNVAKEPEAERQAEVRTALVSNVEFTGLPITGTWQQVEPAGNKRKVHFLLSLPPGVTAINAEQENHISVDFVASAVDATGKEAARISQRVDRKLPPAGAGQLQATGLGYANTLTLPPGSYEVHFVIRDNVRGSIGSVVTPLTVQ